MVDKFCFNFKIKLINLHRSAVYQIYTPKIQKVDAVSEIKVKQRNILIKKDFTI